MESNGSNESGAPVIWLRQSARFQVGEQRRTIAIAIPVRPGASADEIERLLGEADAGMAALTRHLDGRIAALLAGAEALGNGARDTTSTAATSRGATLPAAMPGAALPASQAAATPTPTARPATPPAATTPAETAPAPVSDGAERPVAGPRPVPPRPTPAAATPPTPPVRATPVAPPPAAPPPAAAPAAMPSAHAGPLSRPEFLAETRTLGLTPQQVMQRLQVRSLDGLDYREALDLLRRQLLDDAGTSAGSAAPAAPARAVSSPPPPSAAAAPRAEPAPYRFDEEDDYDVTITVAGGAEGDEDDEDADGYSDPLDEMDGMEGMADSGSDSLADDLDDLPDVPDLDEAPPPPPAARRGAPSGARAASAPAARESAAPPGPAGPQRGRELLEHFRGITPGGAATPDQIKAYTNLIVSQLDATQAGTLVRGIWGAAPNRIGFDQLYALIQWGKEDAFAEEAPAVLAAIKAESAGKGGAVAHTESAAHDAAPPTRSSRPARAPRAGGGGDA